MTSASQFQTQGAFETYFNTGSSTIYLGTDPDNANLSGSLVSVPYYKRGYISASSAGAGTQTIHVPGSSSVVSVYIENRNGAAITAGTFTIVGAYRYTGSTASNTTVTASLGTTLTANTASAVPFTSSAANDGGAFFISDIGKSYATLALTLSGATGFAAGTFLVYSIGFVDTSFYNTPGQ